MTPEEKHSHRQQRNAAIVAYYRAGYKLKDCASRFTLGRQRVVQILQAAGVWQPYVKGHRTTFLGVNLTAETKDALRQKASAEGKSASKFVSDVIEERLR